MTTSQQRFNPEATVWACWGEAGSADAVAMFAASLRQFGGRMAECPVRVYAPEGEMAMWHTGFKRRKGEGKWLLRKVA